MAIYTVLEPPPGELEDTAAADRTMFVRDGFHWAAFVFGAIWMIWHRLWLVLLGYAVLLGALEVLFWALGTPSSARTLIEILVALLIGFEAPTLRRWTLLRRGWRERGIVVADDHDAAEHRYFGGADSAALPAAPLAASLPAAMLPAGHYARPPGSASTGVVGLFPAPGGSR